MKCKSMSSSSFRATTDGAGCVGNREKYTLTNLFVTHQNKYTIHTCDEIYIDICVILDNTSC